MTPPCLGLAQRRQDEDVDAMTTEEDLVDAAMKASQSQYEDELAKVPILDSSH